MRRTTGRQTVKRIAGSGRVTKVPSSCRTHLSPIAAAPNITYIRLETEFVYLAVILDACSRRVIGWALDRTLEDDLAQAALAMALDRRTVLPGLVHHSDRGVQYASRDYTSLLHQHSIAISVSRKGNPTITRPANRL